MSLPQLIRCKTKNNCFIMLWLVLLSQIQKFHWRRNNGLKLSLHAKGLSQYAISHFNIFRPRIRTFPIQIGHLTTKELKINELYSGMIKISLVFNNRKRKENGVFLSLASHMLITVWLLMMFLAKWKKMLMLLKKMNKKGKKADREKKVATTRYQSQFLLLEISAIHCTTLANRP